MLQQTDIQQAKQIDILSLIPTEMRQVSTHNGGEFSGPCPACGGDDRFRAWPASGRFWCRKCDIQGDQIDLIQQLQHVTFNEAVKALMGGPVSVTGQSVSVETNLDHDAWKVRAREFIEYARKQMNPAGMEFISSRGLHPVTAWAAGLGWNPEAVIDDGERWGFSDGRSIYLGKGLVIPHETADQIRAMNIRTVRGYRIVKGSRLVENGRRLIYKPDPWPVKEKLILFEGELDALSAWQCLLGSDEIGVGAIPAGNLKDLSEAGDRKVYVCFDTDQAGRSAALEAADMGAEIIQLPDEYKDFNDLLAKAGETPGKAFLFERIDTWRKE